MLRPSQRPLASINGETITRNDLENEMRRLHGVETLRRIIIEKAVLAEAERRKLMPSDEEIDREMDLVEQRDPEIFQRLAMRRLTEEDFRTDVRGRLALRNLRIASVEVSVPAVKAFYKENKELFRVPEILTAQMLILPDKSEIAAVRQQLQNGVSIDVVASQPGVMTPDTDDGEVTVQRGLFSPDAEKRLFGLAVGDVSEGVRMGDGTWAVFRVSAYQKARQMSVKEAWNDAKIAVRLANAPPEMEVIGAVLAASKIKFQSDRYEGILEDYLYPTETTELQASSE